MILKRLKYIETFSLDKNHITLYINYLIFLLLSAS